MKDHSIAHKNVVSQDRWYLVIVSVTPKYTSCQEYLVFQERWSLKRGFTLSLWCWEVELQVSVTTNCLGHKSAWSQGLYGLLVTSVAGMAVLRFCKSNLVASFFTHKHVVKVRLWSPGISIWRPARFPVFVWQRWESINSHMVVSGVGGVGGRSIKISQV